MIEALPTHELSYHCNEQTLRYRHREPVVECYGMELFRRAIVLRDESAWAAIYAQYADAVRHWIGHYPDEDDADELVMAAFERFWRAVDASKFALFPSLAAVLRYLKTCAQSARLDHARVMRARARQESLDETIHLIAAEHDLEGRVTAHVDGVALWRAVEQCLTDEQERRVLYLCYVLDLPPREIRARYGAQFPSVADVHRVKRAALGRLRRSPAIAALI